MVVALLAVSCSKSATPSAAVKAGQRRAIPVTVAAVIQKDVPLELDTFGMAQSKASVTIKAQVAQVIETVHFQGPSGNSV